MNSVSKKMALVLVVLIIVVCFTGCKKEKKENTLVFQGVTTTGEVEYNIGNLTCSTSSINEIVINWGLGNIKIVPSDSDKINAHEDEKGYEENQRMHWRMIKNTLEVEYCEPDSSVNLDNAVTKDLLIYMPSNLNLVIKTGKGDVNIDSMNMNTVSVESNSGNIDVTLDDEKGATIAQEIKDGEFNASGYTEKDGKYVFGKGECIADFKLKNGNLTVK